MGEVTRLYVNADGSSYVDVPTAEIEHFEAAPDCRRASPAFLRNCEGSRASRDDLGFPGRPNTDLDEVVNEASGRYRLDPDLVTSVIKAESGFNVRAVSPKGAQGLMQLMPGTASQLGVPNVFDPQANVEGGTQISAGTAGALQLRSGEGAGGLQRGAAAGGAVWRRASVLRDAGVCGARGEEISTRRKWRRRRSAARRSASKTNRNTSARPAPARCIETASLDRTAEGGCPHTHRSQGRLWRLTHKASFDPLHSVIYLGIAVSHFALRGSRRGDISPSWIESAFWPAWWCSSSWPFSFTCNTGTGEASTGRTFWSQTHGSGK